MKEDLLELTRQLRRRAEQTPERFSAKAPKTQKAPAAVRSSKYEVFAKLAETVEACRLCPLGSQRLKAVFGVGTPDAEVMLIGEGPGFEEDHRGEPFVGKSGQLLDRILESIGLARQAVYIANIVKCHPMVDPSDPEKRGNDRPPTPEEIDACRGYLDEQIRIIRPKVIVTLGAVAARVLLGPGEPITKIRGQWKTYTPKDGTPVKLLPTFHPAALLRNPNLKKDVWVDMKNLRAELSAPQENA